MGGGARDFQAVLEGVLLSPTPIPVQADRSCVAGTPDPGLLLSLFGASAFRSGVVPVRRSRAALQFEALRTAQPKARVASAHSLTPAQRAALDYFRAAGAPTLDDGFTSDALKQAFRQLALRYHPDRHPGCTERDRRRLAATFAGVHDAYRTLLEVTRVH